MKLITYNVPDSLYNALAARMETDKASCNHVVSIALSQYLGQPIHTLIQVSTSAALVEGLYQEAAGGSRLLRHGDFGLGTFIDLDGEMVVLEDVCCQVASDGVVTNVERHRLIPYAVVTRFSAEFAQPSQQINSFSDLVVVCDGLRSSENVFYAFRVDGKFSFVKTRVMKTVPQQTGLKAASSRQKEFTFEDQESTLVSLSGHALKQAAEAHRDLESRKSTGKLVLSVGG